MSPTRTVPSRRRRARRAGVGCVIALALLTSCGGGGAEASEQALYPALLEVGVGHDRATAERGTG